MQHSGCKTRQEEQVNQNPEKGGGIDFRNAGVLGSPDVIYQTEIISLKDEDS
jgi:hypothetical protein